MTDSILELTKKNVNVSIDDDSFDLDIITAINTTFFTLNQLGIGPEQPFEIAGKQELWADFFGSDPKMNSVKSYMHLSVRLLFDPPATSFGLTAMEKQVDQLGWRLNIARETNQQTSLSSG